MRVFFQINTLADRLVNPLYNFNFDLIRQILSTEKKQKNINYALIYDEDCKIIHDGTGEIALYGKQVEP